MLAVTFELLKPQHILEHVAVHILFDSTTDATSEPSKMVMQSPLSSMGPACANEVVHMYLEHVLVLLVMASWRHVCMLSVLGFEEMGAAACYYCI
jgi:hypothetical protein